VFNFTLQDEERMRPKNFSSLSYCAYLMTLLIGFTTSTHPAGINRMVRGLGVSSKLGQTSMFTFTFNFACAIAPLFLAPLLLDGWQTSHIRHILWCIYPHLSWIGHTPAKDWMERGIARLPTISIYNRVPRGFHADLLQIRKYELILASRKRRTLPELRLCGAMFGAIWLPISLVIYSVSQYGCLPWIAPTIALVSIAVTICSVFKCRYNFTLICYAKNPLSRVRASRRRRSGKWHRCVRISSLSIPGAPTRF